MNIIHIYYNLEIIKEHTEDAFKYLSGDVGVNLYILNNELSNLQTDYSIYIDFDEEDESRNEIINELVKKYPPIIVEMKNQIDTYFKKFAQEAKTHNLNL